MKKILLIALFAGLVVVSGVAHGIRTERWASTPGLEESIQRLDALPLEFADWRGEPLSVSTEDLRRAGIKGHRFNRYRNTRTGAAFNVLLVCGRMGPICVHTPDICYQSAGYSAVSSPENHEVAIDEQAALKLKRQRFIKPNSTSAAQLEICWAWRGGELWAAPDNPRMLLARYPVLYKMYVIRDVSPRQQQTKADPLADFMKDFLPEVNNALSTKLSLKSAS